MEGMHMQRGGKQNRRGRGNHHNTQNNDNDILKATDCDSSLVSQISQFSNFPQFPGRGRGRQCGSRKGHNMGDSHNGGGKKKPREVTQGKYSDSDTGMESLVGEGSRGVKQGSERGAVGSTASPINTGCTSLQRNTHTGTPRTLGLSQRALRMRIFHWPLLRRTSQPSNRFLPTWIHMRSNKNK